MSMKVSTNMFFDKSSKMLSNVQSAMAKTQEQLTTGLQITKPVMNPSKLPGSRV